MESRYVTAKEVAKLLPKRRPDSHKGENGIVLVVGGSEDYVGAPAFVALAALRAGADLAIVAAPEKVAWVINTFSPDLITRKLPGAGLADGLEAVMEEAKRATAVVVGPGLGMKGKTAEAVLKLAERLREADMPVLFDADGLKSIGPRLEELGSEKWVLTPHAGEFQKISGWSLPTETGERGKMVLEFAKKSRCVVLLKGRIDIIASPAGHLRFNRTGNPGMTVGGTGDVLAGIVGAFLSQGLVSFDAALAGAWICGRAGDLCEKEKGYGFLSSDVIEKIPAVLKELKRWM